MKKKIVILLVVLCIMCNMTACGEKIGEKAALITIDDKEYLLSGDMQEVVGTMVADGLRVMDYNYQKMFDEQGKWSDEIVRGACDVTCSEIDMTKFLLGFTKEDYEEDSDEHGRFVRKTYQLVDMEDKNIVSGLGISSIDDVEEAMEQMKSLKYTVAPYGADRYSSVLVDGNVLDFSEYEDELEAIEDLEDSFDKADGGIVVHCFPHIFGFGVSSLESFSYCQTYEELEHFAKKKKMSLDEELLLAFALEDAYVQLEEKEIERIMLITVDAYEDRELVYMSYYEYTLEDSWDPEKFR